MRYLCNLVVIIILVTVTAASFSASANSQITVINTDIDGVPINGIELSLYNTSEQLVETRVTDSNGLVTFTNLEKGSYKIIETKMPKPYQSLGTTYQVQITDANQHKQLENKVGKIAYGQITVRKVDKFGRGLFGCEYIIYDQDWNIVDRTTTSEDGLAQSIDLPNGIYYITQSKAPKGYIIDSKVYTLYVGSDMSSAEFISPSKLVTGDITFSVADENKKGISGASFIIVDTSGKTIATAYSNKNGVVTFENIEYGSYQLILKNTIGSDKVVSFDFYINDDGKPVGVPSVITIKISGLISNITYKISSLVNSGFNNLILYGVIIIGSLLVITKIVRKDERL